ncbi:MAG: SGNH/GDSL hydrolase family protein [Calditrichaeota bacterium]|nr:MAG: SGNH/GDSL hydrolase family protein [Calditrichota bacterium]
MQNISKTILINILILFGFFFILEIGARFYASFFVEGKSFFRESTFVSPWITSNDFPPPKIDENGKYYFRHKTKPTPKQKPENTFRIITVGGSTTANERAFYSDEADYAIELEKLLSQNSKGKNIEVLNAGADAYSTAQSLINIQFRLLEFEPDLIILMHNVNDRSVNYFGKVVEGDYSNKYLEEVFLNPELQVGYSFYGFIFQSRLLAKFGLPELLASKGSINYDNNIEDGIRIFKRNLTSISQICKQNGVELILLSQPNSFSKFYFEGEKEQIILYDQIIKEVAEANEVIFVDMFSEMGQDKELFVDPVHYSLKGIQKFAKILSEEISANLE